MPNSPEKVVGVEAPLPRDVAGSDSDELSDEAIRETVRCAIEMALVVCSPAAAPFLVLREAGVVAEIRAAINTQLDENRFTTALLSDRVTPDRASKPGTPESRPVRIMRVQLEVKAYPDNEVCSGLRIPRTDLVVLRKGAQLHCWPHGAGDVVALIPANSVASLVEVKASPSFNIGELLRYADDIKHMLEVMRRQNGRSSSAFFVLLDKSLRHFGLHKSNQAGPPLDWGFGEDGEKCFSSLARTHPAFRIPRTETEESRAKRLDTRIADLGIQLTPTEPLGRPFVEILGIRENAGAASPRTYAYLR